MTDAATLCAALLHDTIEDTDTTADELSHEFGEEIASIVGEVTDDKTLPKAERKRQQVEHAAHISDKAKRVKLADKISNLRDVAFKTRSAGLQKTITAPYWMRALVGGESL